MEFSSLPYFTFWSLVSIAFSIATTYSLSHTTIFGPGRNTIEYFFLLSVNCSISYALLFRKIGISFPVTWSSFSLWESQSSPILHIIAWSLIGTTYLLTGMYALGLTTLIPESAFYIFLTISSCLMNCLNFFRIGGASRDKHDLQFMVDFLTQHAPLACLASVPFRNIVLDKWNFEFVSLMHVLAVGYQPIVMIPLIMGFRKYCTQKKYVCWILIQFLFLLSFRVCNKLGFLTTTLQTLTLISHSVVIPGFFRVIASLLECLVAKSSMVEKSYQQRRIVEIVFGMFANVIAQYYIRVESKALLFGCLFMAVAWLGNIANVNPATDFGIFQFFVSAALQCAVSLYGLHFYTFLVVAVGIALMVLRWKMESVLLSRFDH